MTALLTELSSLNLPRPIFERMVFVLMRKISNLVDKKFYRYGGPRGVQTFTKTKGGKGYGILYFMGDGLEAIRFNYETRRFSLSPKITSLDYWDRWMIDKPANYTVIIPTDMNPLAIIHTIVDFIKRPHLAKLSINESTEINEAYDRVGVDKWAAKAIEMYGRTQITQKEMQAIRDATNWVIPNVIWKNEIEGTKPKRWQIPGETVVNVYQGENETSSDDERAIATFVKQAEKVDVAQLFSDLVDLTEMVGDGFVKALLVTGGAGTGKTHTITSTLEKMGLIEDEDWIKVSGKTSAMGLYSTLFVNRDGMIVFDDCDSVFASEETRNILKAALDTSPRRVVSWNSKATVNLSSLSGEELENRYAEIEAEIRSGSDGEDAKLPQRFEFTGRIIFISNLAANKVEDAIRSRSAHIDVTLTPHQIFDRIEVIMASINVEGVTVSMSQKKELLEYLRKYANQNPQLYVSMRNFVKGLSVIGSGKPNWAQLVKYV